MKKLELKDGYYCDKNNNKWSELLETLESAIKKSESLSGCSGCSGCSYCRDCSDCRGCSDCIGCRGCRDCRDCRYCSGCRDCSDCRDCRDCSGYNTNPQRFVTKKIGSRNDNTSFYWTNNTDLHVVCGCFRGDLEEFELKVKKVHANTIHLNSYLKEIEKVKFLLSFNE